MINRRQFSLGTLFAMGTALPLTRPLLAQAGQVIDLHPSSDMLRSTELVQGNSPSYIDPEMSTGINAPIGAEMVLAFDVSGSIDSSTNEYQSQLNAMADSIERDDFREAIFSRGGPGSLALFVIDFDSYSRLQIGGVDFRENHPAKFREFAARLRSLPRRSSGGTDHAAALQNAHLCFQLTNAIWPCKKRFVNVLTDGDGYQVKNLEWIEKLAKEDGASVSSMVTQTGINSREYDWCKEYLRTKSGIFGPDGKMVPEGVTEEIATETDTRATNMVAAYSNNLHRILRNQLQLQASNQLFTPKTRFASAEQIENPQRRFFLTGNSTYTL